MRRSFIVPMLPLHVGTKIMCRYKRGDTAYSGRVTAVHMPSVESNDAGMLVAATYDVMYDDGDFETGVPREMLWLKPRRGVLGRIRSKVRKALKKKQDIKPPAPATEGSRVN